MDGRQFDALTRLVSERGTRRATLKGLLGWVAKGTAVAVGVAAASSVGTGTAEAAKCGNGLAHCGKACYDPRLQQCCQKGRDPIICLFSQSCSTATASCGSMCCDTATPFCCDCATPSGNLQCQSTPCAEPACIPA